MSWEYRSVRDLRFKSTLMERLLKILLQRPSGANTREGEEEGGGGGGGEGREGGGREKGEGGRVSHIHQTLFVILGVYISPLLELL